MMKIDVDGTQLESLLHTAIVQSLGDSGREAIIREAVQYLTAKTESSPYDRTLPTSPLMRALHNAAHAVAVSHLKERLANDKGFVEDVEKLYADAAKRMFDVPNREKLVEKLAEAMGRAISQDRY